jgi:hypothetical protein
MLFDMRMSANRKVKINQSKHPLAIDELVQQEVGV